MTAPAISGENLTNLRRLIWLYFWLLLFEGALRKWVFPSLSAPLLIVRDPVVIAIYLLAIREGIFPTNGFIYTIIGLAGASLLASLVVNFQHPAVTLYGLRTDFLHLPLIFLMPRVFRYEDLRRMGFYLLISAIPMAFLVFRQFTSPADAWINTGAGAGSAQMESALGKIRAAGTFSFCGGLVSYATLLWVFLLYHFFKGKCYPKWLAFSAAPALCTIVMLSASRSNLGASVVMVVGALIVSIYRPKLLKGSLGIMVTIAVISVAAGSYEAIRDGADVLETRIETSGGFKEGIVDRFLSAFKPGSALSNAPAFGYGIGMGTNAAAGMLTGERVFLFAEDEWDRVLLESGPLLGGAYILMRLALALTLFRLCWAALDRGHTLGVLLFLSCFLLLINGQFGQPTNLGFAVFTAGLCLTAATVGEEEPVPESVALSEPAPVAVRRQRGRSVYAETLNPR